MEISSNKLTKLHKGKPGHDERDLIYSNGSTKKKPITTNQIEGKIEITQENSKCRLCLEKHERVNLIISESSKLAKKDVRKVNPQEIELDIERCLHY